MIERSDKKRHEIFGGRIRALYGHSIGGKIQRIQADPPGRLFHGISAAAWAVIATMGLVPKGRQYVHLSVDMETATAVGRRKSNSPVVLEIDAEGASAAGTTFYEGNEVVWLANTVPVRFLASLGDGR